MNRFAFWRMSFWNWGTKVRETHHFPPWCMMPHPLWKLHHSIWQAYYFARTNGWPWFIKVKVATPLKIGNFNIPNRWDLFEGWSCCVLRGYKGDTLTVCLHLHSGCLALGTRGFRKTRRRKLLLNGTQPIHVVFGLAWLENWKPEASVEQTFSLQSAQLTNLSTVSSR